MARLMRDRSVGSVVICDPEGAPAAMITDRDVAVRVAADDLALTAPAGERLAAADLRQPEMDLEAAALVVQHRIRRLPVVERES